MTFLNDAAAKAIQEAMDARVRALRANSPTTHMAEVIEVDADGVTWVHIFGGADRTPAMRSLAQVSKGDLVTVTIDDGVVTINGSSSNPSASVEYVEAANYAVAEYAKQAIAAVLGDVLQVKEAVIERASIQDLNAVNATVQTLTTAYANINTLVTGEFSAIHADIGDLEADNATINGKITAAEGRIGTIEADYLTTTDMEAEHARVGTLLADYAEIDLANVNNAWINNGVIDKAAIFDANVFDITGQTATISEINAANINVTNLHTSNLTVDTADGYVTIGNKKTPTKEFLDSLKDELQQEIDGAVETFTVDHVPLMLNSPATDWALDPQDYDTTEEYQEAQRKAYAKHVGDIAYVTNAALDQNGYCYRFAYDSTNQEFRWVLIKDSDVTKALSDISDLQTFESETSTWINETDEGLETIRTNHTTLSGIVDKTVKKSVQLWYTKANTTAPNKPTAQVTSTSTSGNAWRAVVPAWNASYPNYYYCWQYELADGTYAWSDVVRDIAMGESQSTSRSAQTTANANIKSSVMLWFTKANDTAPSKPTAQVTTNNAATANAWNLAVPTYNASYPHYFYCYQQQKGDGTYQWTDVVYDKGTTEAMEKAQAALPSSTFTTFQQTTFKDVKDTVDEQSSTITQLTKTVEENYDAVLSRGEQLITNGSGTLGDNTNFTEWTYDPSVSMNGSAGSFTISKEQVARTPRINEFIPVNTSEQYLLSFDVKSDITSGTLPKLYSFVDVYDIDKNAINYVHVHYPEGTLTTLSRELKTGDTEVYLTNVDSSFVYASNQNGLSFWNYSNSKGYTYPPGTYTRNVYTGLISAQNKIDTANNKIILSSAWAGPTYPSGTYVSMSQTGATYIYVAASNIDVTSEMMHREGTIGPGFMPGNNSEAAPFKFREGTAYAKIGFLWNYQAKANAQIWLANLNFRINNASAASVTTLTNTVNSVSQTATSNQSTISQLTTTLGTNADGTTKTGDVVQRMSSVEQDLSGFKTTVSSTYATQSALSTTNGNVTAAQTDATNALNRQTAYSATSSTGATTAAKVASCTNFPTLAAGATVTVRFSTANTSAGAITLNVNSTGAKTIYVNGAATSSSNQLLWATNANITFTYDGTYWRVDSEPRSWYGTCGTAAGTAAKTSTINEVVVCKGTSVTLNMTYENTNTSATLDVTSNTANAKNIYYGTTTTRPTTSNGYGWTAASTVTLVFDGAYWRIGDTTSLKRVTNAESSITQTATSITSLVANNDTYTAPDGTTQTNTIKSAIVQNSNAIALRATKSEAYQMTQPNLTPFFSSHNTDGTYPNGGVGGYWQESADKRYNRTGFTALEDGWAHVVVSGTTHHEFVPPMVDGLVSGDKVTMFVEWRNVVVTGDGANFYTRNYASNVQLYTNWYFGTPMNSAVSGETRYSFTVGSAAGDQTWNGLVNATFTCKSGATFEGDIRISFYKEIKEAGTNTYIQYVGPYKPYSGEHLYASQAELKVANDNISSKVSSTDYNGNTIATLINQDATTVSIEASKVNITGSVIFSALGSANKVVTSTQTEWYSSTSATSKSGGSWATTQPSVVAGRYIWQRTKRTYSDGSSDYQPSEAGVCIQGQTNLSGYATENYVTSQGYQTANQVSASVSSAIDNLEIGGRNLLLQSQLFGTAEKTNRIVGKYNNNELLVSRADGFNEIQANANFRGISVYADSMGLAVGEKLILSTNVRSDSTVGTNLLFYCMAFNASGTRIQTALLHLKTRVTQGDSAAANIYADYSFPAGAEERIIVEITWLQAAQDLLDAGGSIRFTIQATSSDWSKGNVAMWAPKLERGNKATDWTPAPEDMATPSDIAASQPFVIGTQTAATRFWTGNCPELTELKDGQQITYWLPYAYKSEKASDKGITAAELTPTETITNAYSDDWLKLTLADGSDTGWIPCYYGGTSRMTSHYGAANAIHLTYRQGYSSNIPRGWWGDANYNTNTNDTARYVQYYNTILTGEALVISSLIGAHEDGKYYQLSGSGDYFILSAPLLWLNKALNSGATDYANIYTQIYDRNLGAYYTSFAGGAVNSIVYLVGTVDGNKFILYGSTSATYLTCTVPTSEQGATDASGNRLFFIPIGRLGNQSNGKNYFNFQVAVPVSLYAFLDGEFRQVTPTEVVSEQYIYCQSDSILNVPSVPNSSTWITSAGESVSDDEGMRENLLRHTEHPEIVGVWANSVVPSTAAGWYSYTNKHTYSRVGDGDKEEGSLKVTYATTTSDGFCIPLVDYDAVVGGEELTLSFEYRTDRTTLGTIYLLSSDTGSTTTNTAYATSTAITASTTDWAKFSKAVTWPSTSGKVVSAILVPYTAASGGWFEVKDGTMKLSKGGVITGPVWTTKPPTYRTTHPVTFVARQRKRLDGTITCSTPSVDDTNTVINGGNIVTGKIDANRVDVVNLNAANITTGYISVDRIEGGSLSIGKLSGDIQTKFETYDEGLRASVSQGQQITDLNARADSFVVTQQWVEANGDTTTTMLGHMSYSQGKLTLDASDGSSNATKAVLSTDKLAFDSEGAEVAYLSNQKLYVTNAQVLDTMQMGGFAWIPRSNGNLSLKWVGGVSHMNLLRKTETLASSDLALTRSTVPSAGIIRLTPTTDPAYAKIKVNYLDYVQYGDGTYTVSFDARLADVSSDYTSSNVIVYLGYNVPSRLANTFNTSYDRYTQAFTLSSSLSSSWQRYSKTVVVPTDLTKGKTAALAAGSYLTVMVGVLGSNKPAEVRNVKLEIGSEATPWSRNPND